MFETIIEKQANPVSQMAASERLAATMSEDHLAQVYEDIHQYNLWEQVPPDQRCEPEPDITHLTEVFLHLIHFTMADDTHRLALPAEVAEVYLNYKDAWPTDECRSCGYRMPYVAGDWLGYGEDRSGRAPKRFFKECALCGVSISQSEDRVIFAMYAR